MKTPGVSRVFLCGPKLKRLCYNQAMKKRAYFNKETQQIKNCSYMQSLRLDKEVWEYIPKIENFINDDGKHQMRLIFDDFTVDITETDESIAANAVGSIISDVEVIDNVGNTNTK